MTHHDMIGRLQGQDIRRYALAGKARLTVRSVASGTRFTYRIKSSGGLGPVYFVQVLTGSDNESDYKYLGFIRGGVYIHGGRKSKIGPTAPSNLAFAWFWRNADALPASAECWHEGCCGRCGRALTVPESIRDGIGPECARKMGKLLTVSEAHDADDADDEALVGAMNGEKPPVSAPRAEPLPSDWRAQQSSPEGSEVSAARCP
jgi:hypothetical protein